jgi:hypothetical protein
MGRIYIFQGSFLVIILQKKTYSLTTATLINTVFKRKPVKVTKESLNCKLSGTDHLGDGFVLENIF